MPERGAGTTSAARSPASNSKAPRKVAGPRICAGKQGSKEKNDSRRRKKLNKAGERTCERRRARASGSGLERGRLVWLWSPSTPRRLTVSNRRILRKSLLCSKRISPTPTFTRFQRLRRLL